MGREACAKVQVLNERTIWIVRIIGIAVILGLTAMFLARMQDRCSSFAPHLFAISSVSGGSVGAAMFTALAQEQARNNRDAGCHLPDQPDSRMSGALETRTRRILSEDLLSPTVSRFLFADVLLQAVPNCLRHLWCVTGFDRARALEASFEEAFAKHAPPDAANPFTHSVYRQWKADAAAPALLINTTEVETGERVVIAPFAPAVGAGTGLRGTLLERAPGLDLRLSTAAAISARFPLISPAASYELGRDSPTGRKRRLVDGGYADNSGIATALDLIEVIAAEARRRRLPVDIRLIALTGVPHDEELMGVDLAEMGVVAYHDS